MIKKIWMIGMMCAGTMTMASTGVEYSGRSLKKVDESTQVGISFFKGTWAEALKKSEDDNKLIFLDAFASWCGPCKRMTAYTFTDDAVGTYFNEHFINVKMDMEKNADGPRLSSKFNLEAYPTLYFINADEEVVHQSLGYQEPEALIKVGETAFGKKDK
ncbi:MAG: DUF255 domain-containing protein [Crocinitomicaceae bacterium]|nr:DUF255 domain-containing protein [Crocinitomicaceae bacterium]